MNMNMLKLLSKLPDGIDTSSIPEIANDGSTVQSVTYIFFGIMGGIALIVIILAGISFILSQGKPEAVNKARNTIIYAAIGLAVIVLAFTIVTFVLDRL